MKNMIIFLVICCMAPFAGTPAARKTKLVYVFPADFKGNVSTLNADETLLAGVQSGPEERKKYMLLRSINSCRCIQ